MDEHYGETNGTHIPHDSGLSVGSMGDAAKVRQLEEEVRELADRANGACTFFASWVARSRLDSLPYASQTGDSRWWLTASRSAEVRRL